MSTTLPQILQQTIPAAPAARPGPNDHYDPLRQLWLRGGEFLVDALLQEGVAPRSQFGETLITETGEQTDHTEQTSSSLRSEFGETTITKTSEGSDESEVSFMAGSLVGETKTGKTSLVNEGRGREE